jgi:Xaa-Pro dipeptidase
VHRIESKMLDSLEGSKQVYSSWPEQAGSLRNLLRGCELVAMQYSPLCAIPYISNVDGGTIELVRAAGVEVVTSAGLIQHFEAALNEAALDSHLEAGRRVDAIRAEAFRWIADALHHGRVIYEWDAAQFVRERFHSEGLLTDSGPIVAVDAHAGDPHYEPPPDGSTRIQEGSFVLLDMWAKLDKPGAIFYDITWTGFCGSTVPDRINKIFDVVRNARDAAVRYVIQGFADNRVLRGFEVDDVTRKVIVDAGFGDCFVHRTGHSIGIDVHANGANMDNLETHDDRVIIPWSCFSIEPGIYLEEFGVRSEIDMFVDATSARVTGAIQDAVVLIN